MENIKSKALKVVKEKKCMPKYEEKENKKEKTTYIGKSTKNKAIDKKKHKEEKEHIKGFGTDKTEGIRAK